MKNFIYAMFVVFFAALAPSQVRAQETASFTVSLNQDVFFGFYPTVAGSYALSDQLDLSFYGIFWTTPSFGTGGGGGLWTEFGAGVSFDAGPLTITPQVGILNGKLLSNGEFGRFFDGVVPNLTVDLSQGRLEGQLYFGYYKSITPGQMMSPDTETLVPVSSTNDFIHYWANLGYGLSPVLSAGAHWEHLYFAPANIDAAAFTPDTEPVAADLYRWVGPYVQLSHPDGHSLRFVAGAVLGEADASFYKMTAAFSF
ncbi:MAG: hypothetical protein D6722_06715 [Bacteroidetes bacterium]|nr:MAG: hypothetical protein D6722_06715 [Bacteroidota bacterium]